MATAVQLSQGNEFSRSSEGGASVDSATRVFRVVLDSPGEAWDIPATIGVNIGDEYSADNPIPCVSFESRAEGDSRLIRLVTARYKATPGFASDGYSDPRSEPPQMRPALWSMSTSLQEITTWAGRVMRGAGLVAIPGPWSPAMTPAGDIVDSAVRLEPVVTINIDQYSMFDGSDLMNYVGFVNSDIFNFSSMTIGVHCCMLQGISSTPVVEQFQSGLFRGFKITFTFGVRSHWTLTRDGVAPIGWDIAQPQCGHNIINTGLGTSVVRDTALALEHDRTTRTVISPYRYATDSNGNSTQGSKVRAHVLISGHGGGAVQTPATLPVPLNDDGSPRSPSAIPPVLINRICLQPARPFGENFSNFGIRYFGVR